MKTFPLRLHDGHLLAVTPTGDWLVDTGAPTTFGRAAPELRVGEPTVRPDYLGMDADTLSALVGTELTGLLGADVLGLHDLLLDIPGGALAFGADADPSGALEVPLRWFMGIPVVEVEAGGGSHTVFFDTGAPLSYLQKVSLEDFPEAGTAEDFYPAFGRFTTATARVPVAIGGERVTLRCGRLPELLGMSLMLAGATGIVGTELIVDRKAMLSPSRDRLLLEALTPGD